MRPYLPFFLVFAVLWMAQLYATAKQSQAFMRSVSGLRSLGETAIGASSHNRMRRRSYVALASDETDLVTGAIELSGITVFARAQPIPEIVGIPLRVLADTEGTDRRSNAAAMAARALLDEELDGSSSEPVGASPAVTSAPTSSSTHLPSRST
jgi:DNA-binding transcriptional regulator of glucitol operon